MRANGNPVFIGEAGASELSRIGLEQKGEGSFDEAWLQRLIHEHPQCLPTAEIEPGFAPLFSVCRELPTRHGPIDNLLMSPDGNMVLVETKLWRNPEARRTVVAQALDYASCLFEMDYSELENAVLKANFGDAPRPSRLHKIFPEGEEPHLPVFIDAVNRNLKRGRVLILVVGDGIRTETERLAASLQSHAGAHFTFALVELAVFQGPGGQGYLVHPRTLAKTYMIPRGIVRIDDRRVSVEMEPEAHENPRNSEARTISEEQFFDAIATRAPSLPDRLRRFLDELAAIGVSAEPKKSLILRFTPPAGKPVSLGYIRTNGEVWTDVAAAPSPYQDLSRAYIEDLAAELGGEIEKKKLGGNWYVSIGGKAPRIEAIADRLDGWQSAIARFVGALRAREDETG